MLTTTGSLQRLDSFGSVMFFCTRKVATFLLKPTVVVEFARLQLQVTEGNPTFDVRGGRSRRRKEPQAQLADVSLDGIVMLKSDHRVDNAFGIRRTSTVALHQRQDIYTKLSI